MYPFSGCIPVHDKHVPQNVVNIRETVCQHFNIHESYLLVKDRKPERIYIKQVMIYLLRKSGVSFADICETLCLSDRNTKEHYKTIRNIISVDSEVRMEVEGLLCLGLANLP